LVIRIDPDIPIRLALQGGHDIGMVPGQEFSTWAGHYTPRRLHKVLITRGIHGLVLVTREGYEEFAKLPREHYIAAGCSPEDGHTTGTAIPSHSLRASPDN
jgi:hypothetical protein